MIVSCPSCSTRYRHSSPATRLGGTAHCSRCDERFPLGQAKRPYLLRSAEPTHVAPVRRMAIGMDDPTLAGRLQQTALDSPGGGSAPAFTYRVLVDEPAGAPAEAAETAQLSSIEVSVESRPGESLEPAFSPQVSLPEPERQAEPAPETERFAAVGEPVEQAVLSPADGGELAEAPRKAPLRDVLAVAMPLVACTALAYGASLWQKSDPFSTSTVGAVIGLLVGWACHRWIRRRNR